MNCGAEISEGVNFCMSCGAKVNASEKLGTVKAPDTEGEFVLASWSDPDPKDMAARHEEVPQKEKPKKKAEPPTKENKEKKKGCLSYIFLFGKVLLIAVGSVFLLVFIMEYFSDDKPDAPKTEQHQPKESVFPKSEKVEKSDNVEPVKVEDEENEGYDDGLTPQERIVYWESLIERSEASIEEELAKGDEADMQKVEDIRFDLSVIRRALKEEKEKLTNK
jgi:hypothetical protein